MDTNEVTIVTGIFDIGRNSWKTSTRSIDRYINFFRFWARIKNHVIVYSDPNLTNNIYSVRKEFGLEKQTTIVPIEDVRKLDKKLYDKMYTALSCKETVQYRSNPQNPESYNALYNFVMYIKPILCHQAIVDGLTSGTTAWMDFGFNHGGEYYTNPEEFGFLWQNTLSKKVHLFCLNNPDNTPIWKIIQTMPDIISGGLIIAPDELWGTLENLYRQSALSLADCGFSDDDQTLALMAYRKNPDIFQIHKMNGWYDDFEFVTQKNFSKVQPLPHLLEKNLAKKELYSKEYIAAIKHYLNYINLKFHGN